MTSEKDNNILALIKDANTRRKGFSQLIVSSQQQLYWMVRKIVIDHEDANDIVQNTFVKAWNNLDSFRFESNIHTWLHRIAVNESLTFLNRKKTLNFIPWFSVEHKLANTLKDDPYFSAEKISLKLHQAILKLPEKQRLVFNMRYYDGLPFEEISEILGTSTGALKANYHIAFKKIEKYLLAD
jgi:RNA polymerase sigma-70 factor (ECF subfamily)